MKRTFNVEIEANIEIINNYSVMKQNEKNSIAIQDFLEKK